MVNLLGAAYLCSNNEGMQIHLALTTLSNVSNEGHDVHGEEDNVIVIVRQGVLLRLPSIRSSDCDSYDTWNPKYLLPFKFRHRQISIVY